MQIVLDYLDKAAKNGARKQKTRLHRSDRLLKIAIYVLPTFCFYKMYVKRYRERTPSLVYAEA